MTIDRSTRDHINAVHKWVKENTRVYSTPSHITLHNIRLNRQTLNGTAELLVGDQATGETISLDVEITGWLKYYLPMFNSPLGAPASYSAIELTESTEQAISFAVRNLLPQLLPLGLHPTSSEWVTTSTPIEERIRDRDEFDTAFSRISEPGFKLVQAIKSV